MPAVVRCSLIAFAAWSLLSTTLCPFATAVDPSVQPANYVAPTQSNDSAEVIRFDQRPTEVGNRVRQQVSIDLEIHSTIIQSGQIANQSTTTIRRRQKRLIEVLDIRQGQVRRARVSFSHARMMSPKNPDPTADVAEAVEGKSYLVTRDGKQLIITDTEGVIPSQEQYELVLGSVPNLGLPNPLAQLLTSRTLRLGDHLELPNEVAERLMGFGDHLGQVQRFELILKELRLIDDQNCALFDATITIVAGEDDPTSIDVHGQVTIETATCRTVEANFHGPLQMKVSDTHYQYLAEGSLQVSIRSRYDTATK